MSFKKKFIIVVAYVLVLVVIINILHLFFYNKIAYYKDQLKLIPEKISFRKEYHSREIMKMTLNYDNYSQNENVISTENISIKLKDINYDKPSGILKANFDFYMTDGQCLEDVRFKLKSTDKEYLFYDNQVGDITYMDNFDYLFYNQRYFFKVANKNLNQSKLNRREEFEIADSEDGMYKTFQMELKLGENYEIKERLDIDFLNVLYRPLGDFLYKSIEPIGEFKFVVNF